MAEAAFNAEVNKRKLPIFVDSAGLGSWYINQPPDPRTIKEVAKHGIDIRNYRGRQIQPQDFSYFSHIIGMDHKNNHTLKELAPAPLKYKIKLLLDYVPKHKNQDIVDPYYQNEYVFSQIWFQISDACNHLAIYFEQLIS